MKPRLDINFSLVKQARFLFGKAYNPTPREFLFNHCRSGIKLALESLGMPPGSGVGVMVYNCHTVMNAVEQAGYKPVFVDVSNDLTVDMKDLRRKANRMSALVITHLFGIVNDVQSIKAEFPDLIVVEDCAHAYGIQSLYGDFAAFSIGQGKLPSLGDGGVLLVKNDAYLDRIKILYENLPDYSFLKEMSLFVRMSIKSLMYRPWVYGWLTIKLKQGKAAFSVKELILPMRMSKGVSSMYAGEQGEMDVLISQRVARANKMIETCGVKHFYIGCNAFMLVLRCDEPKRIQQMLYKHGVDSATHFANSMRWAAEFGYEKGDCPNAESLINHLLMIPTY